MKKLLVIVCALIVVAACAAPPPANQNIATTNANTAASPVTPAMTEAEAIAKEKAIWEAIRTKDYVALAAMIAEDQLELVPEGAMNKAATVEGVKQFEPSEVTFSDWKYLAIDRDAYIVVYKVSYKGKYAGKDFPPVTAHASSAWVDRGGKWQGIYHQECQVKPPMTPLASKTPTATPVASPAPAEAAPVVGSDFVANEKMVWDLFRAKRYDAFAELLATDFIEVTPYEILDRAGTIKGVTMFDASKAELSDFKTVTLDADATIVTYTVKNPVPGFDRAGERHATLWARRDGKWMGLFHHGGTPVRPPAPTPRTSPSPSPSIAASPAATRTP